MRRLCVLNLHCHASGLAEHCKDRLSADTLRVPRGLNAHLKACGAFAMCLKRISRLAVDVNCCQTCWFQRLRCCDSTWQGSALYNSAGNVGAYVSATLTSAADGWDAKPLSPAAQHIASDVTCLLTEAQAARSAPAAPWISCHPAAVYQLRSQPSSNQHRISLSPHTGEQPEAS